MRCIGKNRRGFTVAELFTTIAAILIVMMVVVGILMPAFARPHRGGGRQLKDATQIRSIAQAMLIWSQQNRDQFPLPSAADTSNATVADLGRAKDTTANIISLLIWNGGISPEVCYSPAEANEHIVIDDDYENSAPRTALDPAKALWDPAFGADFTGGNIGNLSYAALETSGTLDSGRRKLWQNTFSATTAVVANRAPRITSIDSSTLTPTLANPLSNTLLIHGGRKTWEGNVAYADGHVTFESALVDRSHSVTRPGGTTWLDCPFFDEPDDRTGSNVYLGIFTGAGEKPSDFFAIFD